DDPTNDQDNVGDQDWSTEVTPTLSAHNNSTGGGFHVDLYITKLRTHDQRGPQENSVQRYTRLSSRYVTPHPAQSSGESRVEVGTLYSTSGGPVSRRNYEFSRHRVLGPSELTVLLNTSALDPR
ncbi:Hypothetical predicted protein, partial [Marmota monax]